MKSVYLKLTNPDVNGESTDKDHAKWIEINAWRQLIKQPKSTSASTAGGHSAGRTEHEDMELVKDLDLASPMLYQAVSGGTTFESAQLDFYRDAGDGNRVKYLEIQMQNVFIASVESTNDGKELPAETIKLRYATIQWKYTKQNSDGSRGGVTQGAWSLTRNDKSFAV